MHCGHSWGTWRDSSSKRPKWDSRYYLFVLVHTLEATFAPPRTPTLLAPTFDARRPDPSIEHGEETLSVLRHLLLSSPRELLEELRPTVSSILRLCCCYMTGGVLSSEWTNVHPTSPPLHSYVHLLYILFCLLFVCTLEASQGHFPKCIYIFLWFVFIISRQTASTLLVLLHAVCADHFLIYLFYQMWVGAGLVEVQS